MIDDETKLKAYGLLKTGEAPRVVAEELGITYPQALSLRKEFNEAEESGTIHNLVDVDRALVHRVAEELKEDIADIGGDVDTKVGELLQGVDGYQVLNVKLQTVAIKLAEKIANAADQSIGPVELESLVNSLTKIQTAFFAKGATINFQQNNLNSSTAETFGGFKRA